jgi:hypothetical protein
LIFAEVRHWSRRIALFVLVVGGLAWAQTGVSTVPSPPPASREQAPAAEVPGGAAKPDPSGATDGDELQPGEDPQNRLLLPFLKHLAGDQKRFWTMPASFRAKDLNWIVPSTSLAAAFVATDSWWSKQVPESHIATSKTISNYGTYSLIGLGGASFLLGQMKQDDQLSEAGLLSGEAAINATAVAYAFKEMTQRQRPYQGNGHGDFFAGGSGFPSEHSAIAWSVASVWAHEYSGWFSQLVAYGLASTVTMTRVTAKQHFPSDAIIGSALGWYFGRQVYRAHHDPELGGAGWGRVFDEQTGERTRNPENMGSPYVPLDSWVYPAMDRLIALGYLSSSIQGMRPWTRLECARLLQEAGDKFASDNDAQRSVRALFDALTAFFQDEMQRLEGAGNVGASLDSVYTRATEISGQPLRDGFHLGQTIINDYGRPYSQGFNDVTGISAHAEAGPLYVALQGEYQKAPAITPYAADAIEVLAGLDTVPSLPNGTPAISRFRLLDSSIGFTYHNFQISFGKQSLWLGPSPGGPFLFSDNAEPIPMLRFDQVSPIYVPGISRILGPMRTEFAVGRLAGQTWDFSSPTLYGPGFSDQPFVHVDKVGFKPTENFEFSMGISAVFGGPGLPVTFGNFFQTYNVRCAVGSCPVALTSGAYGDRRSTADLSYRIPHIRDWATFYMDSLVEDEVSPIGSSRPALREGLYLAKLPKLPKLDLRTEAVYTDAPNTVFIGNYYDNGRYLSGYTNYGQIMGSWIGRAGKGGQAWATYWFSPRTTLQLQYRREVVSHKFLPGGGGLSDFGVKGQYQPRSDLSIQAFLQYEVWNFPVLETNAKSNVTASIQLTFCPEWALKK